MQENKKKEKVFVSENTNKVVESSKEPETNVDEKHHKKKEDRIHKEIMGEFSRYGMRVHYGFVIHYCNNPYLIR